MPPTLPLFHTGRLEITQLYHPRLLWETQDPITDSVRFLTLQLGHIWYPGPSSFIFLLLMGFPVPPLLSPTSTTVIRVTLDGLLEQELSWELPLLATAPLRLQIWELQSDLKNKTI